MAVGFASVGGDVAGVGEPVVDADVPVSEVEFVVVF